MATAMIYDTLKLAQQLEHEAGFDIARAKTMARVLVENASRNLVTREDVKIGALDRKVRLDANIDRLRRDIRVLCWMTGATLVGVVAVWAIIITVALHVVHLE